MNHVTTRQLVVFFLGGVHPGKLTAGSPSFSKEHDLNRSSIFGGLKSSFPGCGRVYGFQGCVFFSSKTTTLYDVV